MTGQPVTLEAAEAELHDAIAELPLSLPERKTMLWLSEVVSPDELSWIAGVIRKARAHG